MKRMKSNVILALTICVCAILCSIGYVQGREDESTYIAPDLLLTQGQAEYDLCEGIKYNGKKYELSVSNAEAFDINTPGSYTVQYLLTPLDDESELETSAGAGTSAPAGTLAPAETSTPAQTQAPAESSTPAQTQAPAESSTPEETQAPAESSTPEETQAPAESSAPAETQSPAESSAPGETQAPAESSAPAETQAPAESSAPEETQAPAESSAPAGTQAPAETDAPAEAAPKDTSTSEGVTAAQETAARAAKEKFFLMERAPALKSTFTFQKPDVPEETQKTVKTLKQADAPESKAALGQGTPAPQGTSEHVSRPDSEKASPSEADMVLDQISFSRTVVVREAVRYHDACYDVDTISDPLTDMDYDSNHYGLSVLDDDGFNGRRIDEYHITYRLINKDNGKRVADLERYVWITASGINFDAPELSLRLNQTGYDLQEGIDYDAEDYALTTIDPDSVDTSVEGEQRVMFRLTLRTKGEDIPEATPAQAVSAGTEEYPTPVTASGSEAAFAPVAGSESEVTSAPVAGSESEVTSTPVTGSESEVTFAPNGQDESAASPSSAEAKQSETTPTMKIEGVPVAAIFGRDVKVENGPVVMIDAPPLVVMEGTAAGQDLLEGVTAKDESGDTVALQVSNRTEIDAAVGNTAPDQEEPTGNTAPAQEEAISVFSLRSAFPGETAGEPEDIPEAGNEVLPAGLPVGEYKVTLSSVHPVTGEVFTAERTISVRAGAVRVLTTGTYTINVSTDNRPLQIKGKVNLTLTGRGTIAYDDTLTNAIAVMSGSTLDLTLANNADITVTGKPGENGKAGQSSAAGGGAGIRVEKGATLTVKGNGRLTAIGGNAGEGGKATGPNGGGGGGGGGGAAIGGNGGAGGEGGYKGHLPGGDAPAIPEVGSITIQASGVTLKNGQGNELPAMTRNGWSANGGGGMPAGATWTSWDHKEEYAGGSGGGGGGAASKFGGDEKGGFGQGYGRNPIVRLDYVGFAIYGGHTYPAAEVLLTADGSPAQLEYKTLADAFKEIKADVESNAHGGRSHYYLTMRGSYNFSAGDQAALTALSGLIPDISIDLLSKRNSSAESANTAQVWFSSSLLLPPVPAGERGATFTIYDIALAGCQVIVANGNKLVLADGITTVSATPDVIGGIYETPSSPTTADLTFTGDTYLEVRSGTYRNICGGNWHFWNSANDTTSTVAGNTTVRIGGKARAAQVYGGSYIQLGGNAATAHAASRQTGDRTVVLSDTATVTNSLYAGGGCTSPDRLREDSVSGTALVTLEGGRPTTVQTTSGTYSGMPKQGRVELQVQGSSSMKNVYDFEAVRLSPNSDFTITGKLGRRASFAAAAKPAMLLDFQGGASLTLKNSACTAGSFRIAGAGNRLILPRTGSAGASLTLDGSQPNQRIDNAQLELSYPAGTAAVFGDKLLYYNPTKQNAVADDYVPQIDDYAVLGNKTTGYVSLESPITWEAADGTLQYCGSMKAAMEAIGNRTGSFTVTVRKEGYKLTEADGIALASQGANASITFTSKFQITPDDALGQGEAVGDWVTRTVLVGAGKTPDSPKSDVILNARNTIIRDMTLRYMQEGCSLYAKGHKLTVGPDVQILSDNNYFPVFYGGAKDGQVASTQMILTSGSYGGIYGGGREAGAAVTGNTSVTFGGNAQLYGSMYGGGREGAVGGNVSLDITGGQVDETSGTNVVVGGGEKGNVAGDVTVSIENASPPVISGAALRQGASTVGTVGGNIQITVTGSKNYGTIQGGRSGLSNPGDPSQNSTITFQGGSHRVQNLMDFDVLNLGAPGIGGASGDLKDRTTLYLTGKLQGKDGDLRFWGGSVLTLQGTSTDPADLVVNNIQTDATQNRSHLHMYKAPVTDPATAVSRPLHILGENLSLNDNKLVLGEYGPATTQEENQVGVYGDKLLQFAQQNNAKPKQYVSDIQGLDIVVDVDDPGVVKLGIDSEIQMSLTRVSHTSAPGVTTQADRPGQTVKKTLTFQINSFAPHKPGEPVKPGNPIQSAYVSKDWKPDPDWAANGNIPAGGTKINISEDTTKPGQWNGTVTMDITPPIEPSPEYYFAHARDSTGTIAAIVLEVHSPVEDGTPGISRDGNGNYTFTVKLWDKKPEKPEGVDPDIIYTASGLRQIAWAVGDASSPPAGEKDALAAKMTEGADLKGVTTLSIPTIASYPFTFTVPAAALGSDPGSKTVYLYAKDDMGNTGVYPIPLNENLMDIQIPLWAGTVALRGGDNPQLLAPTLYVVNWSEKPVMAELVGAEIPNGQGTGDGKLQLTGKSSAPWGPNELNLLVKPVYDGLGSSSFPITSVAKLNSGAGAVNLGIMPDRNKPNHGTSFTFEALYDPESIPLTKGWSRCVLTYRFSLNPPLKPSPDPASAADLDPPRMTNQMPDKESRNRNTD